MASRKATQYRWANGQDFVIDSLGVSNHARHRAFERGVSGKNIFHRPIVSANDGRGRQETPFTITTVIPASFRRARNVVRRIKKKQKILALQHRLAQRKSHPVETQRSKCRKDGFWMEVAMSAKRAIEMIGHRENVLQRLQDAGKARGVQISVAIDKHCTKKDKTCWGAVLFIGFLESHAYFFVRRKSPKEEATHVLQNFAKNANAFFFKHGFPLDMWEHAQFQKLKIRVGKRKASKNQHKGKQKDHRVRVGKRKASKNQHKGKQKDHRVRQVKNQKIPLSMFVCKDKHKHKKVRFKASTLRRKTKQQVGERPQRIKNNKAVSWPCPPVRETVSTPIPNNETAAVWRPQTPRSIRHLTTLSNARSTVCPQGTIPLVLSV